MYRELAAMATAGLVEVGTPGPRDRKPYGVTEAGRAAFAEWIDRDPGLEQIRFPLLLTIMFAGHLAPQRLVEILAAHRAVHAERLAGYQRTRKELDEALDECDGAGGDHGAAGGERFRRSQFSRRSPYDGPRRSKR